jgi:hypothetical protein
MHTENAENTEILVKLCNELKMLRQEISDLKLQTGHVIGDVKDLKNNTTVMIDHVDYLHHVYNCAKQPINTFLVAIQSVSEWILKYDENFNREQLMHNTSMSECAYRT